MKRQYKGTITYKMKPSHPDIEYLKGDINEPLEFADVYTINKEDFDNNVEEIHYFIKRDLTLVAGGGYDSEHIYDVSFNIQ